MSDEPRSHSEHLDVPLPTAHVRLVLTLELDGPHSRGLCHWHVRDVTTGAKLLSASWPFERANFDLDYCGTRFQKALSDAWASVGPF